MATLDKKKIDKEIERMNRDTSDFEVDGTVPNILSPRFGESRRAVEMFGDSDAKLKLLIEDLKKEQTKPNPKDNRIQQLQDSIINNVEKGLSPKEQELRKDDQKFRDRLNSVTRSPAYSNEEAREDINTIANANGVNEDLVIRGLVTPDQHKEITMRTQERRKQFQKAKELQNEPVRKGIKQHQEFLNLLKQDKSMTPAEKRREDQNMQKQIIDETKQNPKTQEGLKMERLLKSGVEDQLG